MALWNVPSTVWEIKMWPEAPTVSKASNRTCEIPREPVHQRTSLPQLPNFEREHCGALQDSMATATLEWQHLHNGKKENTKKCTKALGKQTNPEAFRILMPFTGVYLLTSLPSSFSFCMWGKKKKKKEIYSPFLGFSYFKLVISGFYLGEGRTFIWLVC